MDSMVVGSMVYLQWPFSSWKESGGWILLLRYWNFGFVSGELEKYYISVEWMFVCVP
jgi:hypothetical protein